jgi:hypothetical protein
MGDGISMQTLFALNQLGLAGAAPPITPTPVALTGLAPTGLSTRPLTAQGALAAGDPKLIAALRRRAALDSAVQNNPVPPQVGE